MKKTIDKYDFIKSFEEYGRKENFTYEGREALFEYLEQLEEDCGIEFELDPIAFCCDYTEYENFEEFNDNYGDRFENIDEVENNTIVIRVDEERFIIQDF